MGYNRDYRRRRQRRARRLRLESWRRRGGQLAGIRNLFRTYRMQRPVIAGFAIVPAKIRGYPRTVVNRTDGETVTITTLSPPQRRPHHPAVEKALAELEAWRREGPSEEQDGDR